MTTSIYQQHDDIFEFFETKYENIYIYIYNIIYIYIYIYIIYIIYYIYYILYIYLIKSKNLNTLSQKFGYIIKLVTFIYIPGL